MHEYYEILGISENASDEELETAYNTLKAQYSKERFLEGDAGNLAAKNLTKLETAYAEIKSYRSEHSANSEEVNFSDVSEAIKQGDLNKAQKILDDFTDRNAEWHYLQSVIFYKKNWTNESKKQLEIALNMEPHNQKYIDAFEKLKSKMNTSNSQFHSGNANFEETEKRQMGGDECGTFADCCCTWCCINLLCNSCIR